MVSIIVSVLFVVYHNVHGGLFVRHFFDPDSQYPDCMEDDMTTMVPPFMGAGSAGYADVNSVVSDGAITLNGVLPLTLLGKGEAYIAGFTAAAAGMVSETLQKKYWTSQNFWEGVLDYCPPNKNSLRPFARVVVITEYRK